MGFTRGAVRALALAACLGPVGLAAAQNQDKDKDQNAGNDRNAAQTVRNSGQQEKQQQQQTIRGVIAGVTVEGETTVDYATHRAQTAEMAFLTIVGTPWGSGQGGSGAQPQSSGTSGTGSSDRNKDADTSKDQSRAAADANRGDDTRGTRSGERRRHNTYIAWLTPRTKVKDATAGHGGGGSGDNKGQGAASEVSLDKLEVGDIVEVTVNRRENHITGGGGGEEHARWARRHGRHRLYFGDAVTVTILAEPKPDRNADQSSSGSQNRDDDKDKVQDKDKDR